MTIQITAMKKPGNKHKLSGAMQDAVVNADPAVAHDVVIFLEIV
jgi:hypothetical protein